MKLTIKKGFELLAPVKESYTNWYNNMPVQEKKDVNNWSDFVKTSVKTNNYNDGTIEDLLFIAMDAIPDNS